MRQKLNELMYDSILSAELISPIVVEKIYPHLENIITYISEKYTDAFATWNNKQGQELMSEVQSLLQQFYVHPTYQLLLQVVNRCVNLLEYAIANNIAYLENPSYVGRKDLLRVGMTAEQIDKMVERLTDMTGIEE